ncbi:MAG: aspartate kinase [Candidatus Nezhaarchaeota archaeon]|nr:aspartate kinase [Candidatus Nezhaarchaeota archaeon]
MNTVMKFGGVCTSSGANILRITDIVRKHLERRDKVVLVTSAMAGVTDTLIELINVALSGKDDEVLRLLSILKERHLQVCMEAIGRPELREEAVRELEESIRELQYMAMMISYLKEATPRSRDRILAFGEKMITRIIWRAMLSRGIKAEYFTGGRAGIITDDNFGQATPLMHLCEERLRSALLPLVNEGVVPIVTGFIGQTMSGVETTLGRGGSDYTATIIGAALGFDEVWVWKDVEGIMTADPKIVPNAKPIPKISYEEATELAYFGAKVLHPLALKPLMQKNIPLRVRSFFNLESQGTLVSRDLNNGKIVKAVTMIPKVALITVSGAELYEAPLVVAKVFNTLFDVRANAIMVSQSSSQTNISIVVYSDKLKEIVDRAKAALPENCEVTWEGNVCVVAVVGSGMRGRPGVAAKVFNSVAEKGVNVRMIAQGASELNISMVVRQEDAIKAVQALHSAFISEEHNI